MRSNPTRVLIVDDSPTALAVLRRLISSQSDLLVVGSALGGEEALRTLPSLAPDVVCVDFVMPGMDGLALAREIVTRFRVPVLMMSGQAPHVTQDLAERSLEAGALEFVAKPHLDHSSAESAEAHRFLNRIRVLAGVVIIGRRSVDQQTISPRAGPRLVVIGASAGGPPALRVVLSALPALFPLPILTAQHMLTGFEGGFRDWLDSEIALPVLVAESGMIPAAGHVYVAPPNSHVEIGVGMRIEVSHRRDASELCPSVDRLFASAARSVGSGAVGVLLSGMGNDGAEGLSQLRAAGSRTIAQSESSSAVWGMPGAAVASGAVEQQLDPASIGGELLRLAVDGSR